MFSSSALRLITGFGNSEITPPKNQQTGVNQKSTLYGDSEELNRVVILTLARAVHIGGLEQVEYITDNNCSNCLCLEWFRLVEGGCQLYHAQHSPRLAISQPPQLPPGPGGDAERDHGEQGEQRSAEEECGGGVEVLGDHEQ